MSMIAHSAVSSPLSAICADWHRTRRTSRCCSFGFIEVLGDRLNAKLKRRQDATQALKNYSLFARPLCHFLEIIMIEDLGCGAAPPLPH